MFINFYLFLYVFFFFAITRSVFHFRVTFRFFVFQSDFMNPSPDARYELKKNQTKQKEEKKNKKRKKEKIKEKKHRGGKNRKIPTIFYRQINTHAISKPVHRVYPGEVIGRAIH